MSFSANFAETLDNRLTDTLTVEEAARYWLRVPDTCIKDWCPRWLGEKRNMLGKYLPAILYTAGEPKVPRRSRDVAGLFCRRVGTSTKNAEKC